MALVSRRVLGDAGIVKQPDHAPQPNPGSRYRCGERVFKRAACGPRQEERGAEIRCPKTRFAQAVEAQLSIVEVEWREELKAAMLAPLTVTLR